ncbi:MAG: DUF2461 domain-containing protein [Clostridia bacterium]|nr:DUF2461 domain-containing protein [Clostridia bacterium]
MFSPKTLDFLSMNVFMNSREWYAEHKPEFKEFVMQPLIETVQALTPTIEKIDPMIVTEPKVDKTISRIYRDMRRAHGAFYRDYMWISFKRDRKAFSDYPEFFFVLSPRGFCYGCGQYDASSETTDCMRRMVLDDHPLFKKAEKAYRAQNVFVLDGHMYKRSRYPDEPERKRIWLDRRTVTVLHDSRDFDRLFSDTLPQEMAAAFAQISPVYRFLAAAEQTARNNMIP